MGPAPDRGKSLMIGIYNFALLPLRALTEVWALGRSLDPRRRLEWAERLGRGRPGVRPGGVWLHGASVGEGRLVTPRGLSLTPEMSVPDDTESILINAQGRIFVRTAGAETETELGQLLLARFVNPAGLEASGGNILAESPSSGTPIVGAPGELGIGALRQGALERSNVDAVEEMISLIVAQRAFEINSKAVRTSEDMMPRYSVVTSSPPASVIWRK